MYSDLVVVHTVFAHTSVSIVFYIVYIYNIDELRLLNSQIVHPSYTELAMKAHIISSGYVTEQHVHAVNEDIEISTPSCWLLDLQSFILNYVRACICLLVQTHVRRMQKRERDKLVTPIVINCLPFGGSGIALTPNTLTMYDHPGASSSPLFFFLFCIKFLQTN